MPEAISDPTVRTPAIDELSMAAAAAGLGTYTYDVAAGTSRCSAELCRMLGIDDGVHSYSVEEFIRFVHPEDRAYVRKQATLALQRLGAYQFRFRVMRADGHCLHVEDRGSTYGPTDAGTGLARIARGALIDISALVAAEDGVRQANATLSSFFEHAPLGMGLWDTQLRFIAVNERLAEINGVPALDHLGKLPNEIVPNIEGLDGVLERWREVLRTGTPWTTTVEGETPADPGTRRCWTEHFFPVRLGGRSVALAAVVEETTEKRAADEARRQSEARLREVLDGTLAFVGVLDTEGRIEEVNARALELVGLERNEVIGQHLWTAPWWKHSPDVAAQMERAFRLACQGAAVRNDVTVHSQSRGDIWVDCMIAPNLDDQGRVRFVTFSAIDISDRVAAAKRIEILVKELNHRAKNVMSLVQSIARQSARHNPTDFLEDFEGRVQALARSQDLLAMSEWKAVDLRALVTDQLSHFGGLLGKRIFLSGQNVQICAASAQTLGMALHELATNAAKYGALATETGTVSIVWSVDPDTNALEMSWTESGGKVFGPPARRGFGTVVIKDLVEAGLHAEVSLDYGGAGFSWQMTRTRSPGGIPGAKRRSKCVLVVEDEILLAHEVKNALEEGGYRVVGPARSAEVALHLIAKENVDLALLDIDLGRSTSESVAVRLTDLGIPFLVLSGYSRDQQPPAFQKAPRIPKPVDLKGLVLDIENIINGSADKRLAR